MMHGDDVASAGVEVTTQIVSKATEIIMDILKLAIEREREAARRDPSKKQQGLSGGEVTYRKLQEGGEVTSIPSFDKNDYGELIKQAKKMNIPVAAIQESEKENTLTLFFNVKDEKAINAIVQDIYNKKLKEPGQTERMVTIEKEQYNMALGKMDKAEAELLETYPEIWKCIFQQTEHHTEIQSVYFSGVP